MNLKIKPVNEVVRKMYENHNHFHQGESGLDIYIIENKIITRKLIADIIPNNPISLNVLSDLFLFFNDLAIILVFLFIFFSIFVNNSKCKKI